MISQRILASVPSHPLWPWPPLLLSVISRLSFDDLAQFSSDSYCYNAANTAAGYVHHQRQRQRQCLCTRPIVRGFTSSTDVFSFSVLRSAIRTTSSRQTLGVRKSISLYFTSAHTGVAFVHLLFSSPRSEPPGSSSTSPRPVSRRAKMSFSNEHSLQAILSP